MNTCLETTGFLFSHPCGRAAGAACTRCGKSVCDAHLVALGMELVCTTCSREQSDESEDSEHAGEDDPSYYYEDYGYYGRGSPWSRHSSHDPHDFTEADGESLRHEDDASFEEDMGGS